MLIIARHALVAGMNVAEPALLLEGSWPAAPPGQLRFVRWSLDDLIDARHGWIDEKAQVWAEEIARRGDSGEIAWLHVLSLRYYLVRLLRLVAFFHEVLPSSSLDGMELILERERDADYAEVISEFARRDNVPIRFHWVDRDALPVQAATPNGLLRRGAAWANERLDKWLLRRLSGEAFGEKRVLMSGNPRILGPICEALVRQRVKVAWLYDRFAFGSFWKWRARGVRQLCCRARSGVVEQPAALRKQRMPGRLQSPLHRVPLGIFTLCSIDLARPINGWLDKTAARRGALQAALLQIMQNHFADFRPTHLVLDQDATPFARAAVAVARWENVPSVVVQHGAPRVAFGFAPLAADKICVWGQSSSNRLRSWGVSANQIEITGATQAAMPLVSLPQSAKRRVVVFYATTPPQDDRPDAVAYHLTTRTHEEMLHWACAAVSQLDDAELLIKLHPRCRDAAIFRRVAGRYRNLRCRIIAARSSGPLFAACVLNCGSSAGIEAAANGVPVIELLPSGSAELLPANAWGLAGSAQSLEELRVLLNRVWCGDLVGNSGAAHQVFALQGRAAADAAVLAILNTHAAAREASLPVQADRLVSV